MRVRLTPEATTRGLLLGMNVVHPTQNFSVKVDCAVIDTGAQVSMIPKSAADSLASRAALIDAETRKRKRSTVFLADGSEQTVRAALFHIVLADGVGRSLNSKDLSMDPIQFEWFTAPTGSLRAQEALLGLDFLRAIDCHLRLLNRKKNLTCSIDFDPRSWSWRRFFE